MMFVEAMLEATEKSKRREASIQIGDDTKWYALHFTSVLI